MSTSEENLYDAVCMYLLEGKYSDKETKNSKKVIRRKAKQTVSYQAICWLLTSIHVRLITTENKRPYANTVP